MTDVTDVTFISPGGDQSADDLAAWAVCLDAALARPSVHTAGPCDRVSCTAAMAGPSPLVCFFGHGEPEALLDATGQPVIDRENLRFARGKTVVSVACEAGLELGPQAVQAGVRAHVGWNVILLWLDVDAVEYGWAMARGLSRFGDGAPVSEVADQLRRELDGMANYWRSRFDVDDNARIAYFAAAAAAGQVAVDGDPHARPLAEPRLSRGMKWTGQAARHLQALIRSRTGGAEP